METFGINNILLCATDAAGVNNLLPVAFFLDTHQIPYFFLTKKNYEYKFSNLEKTVFWENIETAENLEEWVKKYPFSKIIVGTTSYLSPDRFLITIAKDHNIKTVAVLDEWYNHRMRFEDEKYELVYLPDFVACLNAQARQEAIREGIPAEICQVTGNPALTTFYQNFQKHKNTLLKPYILEKYPKYQIITFLSEEFRADYGNENQRLGEYQGYDEVSVLEDLKEILAKNNQKILLIEKLHPSSQYLEQQITVNENITLLTIKYIDLLQLLYFSDLVIGMRSIALLQSAMIGKKTVSYQPNLRFENLCTAVKLDLIPCFTEKKEFENWFSNHQNFTFLPPSSTQLDFVKENCIENILNL